MNGHLRQHPPAELIREISLENLSGALRLTHGRIKAIIYFNAGEIVYAGSNLRSLRLAECVQRWQIIPEEKLAHANAHREVSDADFGKLLIAAGLTDAEGVARLKVRQAAEAFCHALQLDTKGEWALDSRAQIDAEMWIKFNAGKFLIESARRTPAELIIARLADDDEMLMPTNQSPAHFDLLSTEAFVLSRVDAAIRLGDLLAISGLAEITTKQIVYALMLGGYLRRERLSIAGLPDALVQAKAETQRSESATIAANESGRKPLNEATRVAVKDEAYDTKAELDELFKRVSDASHYEVLGVSRSVSTDALKSTYYALAKRFHPDRFHREADAEMRARIESAFARIAQAYETLNDRSTRATYDLKLSQIEKTASLPGSPVSPSNLAQDVTGNHASSSSSPPSPTFSSTTAQEPQPSNAKKSTAQTAEESFQIGVEALEKRNDVLATAQCGEAARLVPNEARYRAQYGRALARNTKTRRLAEAEFLAAISLDSQRITYRVWLAELYRDIGLKRRAEGELQRALVVDPQNAAARRLLNELHAA